MKKEQKPTKKPREKPKGIESKITDLTDYTQETIISLYGIFGSGKTALASTAPKPILFIDTLDRGLDSARNKNLKKGEISVMEVSNMEDADDILDYLYDNPEKYKSIVIDTATGIQNMIEADEKGTKKLLTLQQRGNIATRTSDYLSRFIGLSDHGMLPILLFQMRKDTLEGADELDETTSTVLPAISPGVQKIVLPASRVIAQTYKYENDDGKIEYRLRLGPDAIYTTKVTKPKDAYCPDYLVNGTIQDILDIIEGNYAPPVKKKKKKVSK